jgi:hypothetical protein
VLLDGAKYVVVHAADCLSKWSGDSLASAAPAA